MKKFVLLLSVSLAGLILAACSTGVTNCNDDTFMVNNTGDVDDGQCDAAHCSLREAIHAANTCTVYPSYTIEVPSGDYELILRGSGDDLGDLDITRDMVIHGEESDIPHIMGSNSWRDRIFDVHAGVQASLHFIWVKDGNSSDNGGGINNDGTLDMRRVIVSKNESDGSGGGMSNAGTATLDYTEFTENLASATSGCGGAIYNTGSIVIVGSSIHANDSRNGKGLCSNNHSEGSMEIRDTYIQDNGGVYAGLGGLGGGINSIAASLTLDNVVVDGNYAIHGGGIYATVGDVSITDSTISNNYAVYGGGMYVGPSASSVRVRQTEFSYNQAQQASGRSGLTGGIGGAVALTTDHFDFDQTSLLNNVAEGGGGGLYIAAPGSTQGYFSHAAIAYNTNPNGPGAGITIVRGQLGMANVTISNNLGIGNGLAFYNGSDANSGFVHVTMADNDAIDHAENIRPIFNEDGGQITFANSLLLGIGDDIACWGDRDGITSRGGNVIAGRFLCTANTRTDDADVPMSYRYGGHTYLPLDEIDGTYVHPIPVSSQAFEFIDEPACNRDDQRLMARPQGSKCEAGAFEVDLTGLSISGEAEPGALIVVPSQDYNCREGNSTQFEIADTLKQGGEFTPLGIGSDKAWFQFAGPTYGQKCWAPTQGFTLYLDGQETSLDKIPNGLLQVVSYPAAPTATPDIDESYDTTPTPIPTCDPQMQQCP